MKSVYNFVVTPKGERYNNIKKVGDSELILNTEIYNHQYINKEAIVISTPIIGNTDIKAGDTVNAINKSQLEIGMNEIRKHEMMHQVAKLRDGIALMQGEFEKEYGTSDIDIQTGTINYPPENGEANKED